MKKLKRMNSGIGTPIRRLLVEGAAIARSRPVVLLVGVAIAAVGIGAPSVLRAAAIRSNDRAIASFERPEFRTVSITSNSEEPILTRELHRSISGFSSVATVIATGQALTGRPADAWPAGQPVPITPVVSPAPVTRAQSQCGSVLVPRSMPLPSSMTYHLDTELAYFPVVGHRDQSLEPFIPPDTLVQIECDWSTVARFVIEFTSNRGLIDSNPLILQLISSTDIDVRSPTDISGTRAQVRQELSATSKAMTVGAVLATGILIGTTSLLSTLTQIRHYARRRALGARRSEAALLIYMQPAISIALGAVVVALAQVLAHIFGFSHLGSEPLVTLATWVVVSATTAIMVVPSAVIAATAEPATLLRVP